MPPLTLRAAFTPSTLDAEKRTVQLTWTTGARVLRGYFEPYYEELSLDPKHVRMGRLQSGAPLLDNHRADGIAAVIGVVESARLEAGRGTAMVRFDRGSQGDEAMRKVADGIVRNVSVGYRTYKMVKVAGGEGDIPTYRAEDWEPHELTLTPIGADAGATVRSADTVTANPCDFEERAMNPESHIDAAAVERTRAAEISKLATQAKLGVTWATNMIEAGTTVEAARAAAFEELVRRDDEIRIDGTLRIEPGAERRDTRPLQLMQEALASRFGGPAPSAEARQYLRLTVVDLARHLLEVRGVSTRMMSRSQIIERSFGGHTTSDFPNLLTGTGNRILRQAYDSYPGGVQQACRETSAPDFRPVNKLQLGEAPTLAKVNEHGEFTRGTMAEGKEAYTLATYGKIFGITRQALINDDLGAFGDMATRLGRSAREFVALQLATLLNSNPTLAVDSTAVFHANHGNLAASGAAISTTTLGAALKSMRLQKGLSGVAINVTPRYLIVPATQETVALQAVAQITPAQTSNANPFAGKYEVVVEPRLDAFSTTAWYLAADPAAIDTIEYAYLDGAAGPEVILREGFDVDGMEWKVRLDFGAGITDYRGLYKNPGA